MYSRIEIEQYLSDIKDSVTQGRFQIERNSNRKANQDLFMNYVIDETKAADIILGLQVEHFSSKTQNRKKGYEHEVLYIFGRKIPLLERFGTNEVQVPLYIKFNKLPDCYVIVVSFHEQKYEMRYPFTAQQD